MSRLVGWQPGTIDGSAVAASSRNCGGRHRSYDYLKTSCRVPYPPAIHQRLLWPFATHDVLQLTSGQVKQNDKWCIFNYVLFINSRYFEITNARIKCESRVFLVDNGLDILAYPEEEALLDIPDQMGGVLVAPGIPSGLIGFCSETDITRPQSMDDRSHYIGRWLYSWLYRGPEARDSRHCRETTRRGAGREARALQNSSKEKKRRVVRRKKKGWRKTKTMQLYNQLGQDCAGICCRVDLFVTNDVYIDLATIGQCARLTGGQVYKYTYFQVIN